MEAHKGGIGSQACDSGPNTRKAMSSPQTKAEESTSFEPGLGSEAHAKSSPKAHAKIRLGPLMREENVAFAVNEQPPSDEVEAYAGMAEGILHGHMQSNQPPDATEESEGDALDVQDTWEGGDAGDYFDDFQSVHSSDVDGIASRRMS
ncbi:hypothetical protein CDL15_Pgr010617 [Punica granatum]|uniref:Uncharacterized protein n=1 Tax=Punica granatum TaxID=22663 RepID=A0A218VRQ9_PUNGR|nr:hypothetical protein CDL15_Pgr010617 [Punica granatum]